MGRKFFVDWDDADYPQIRDAYFDLEGREGQSMTACKKEIRERAATERRHWAAVVAQVQSLKADDIPGKG